MNDARVGFEKWCNNECKKRYKCYITIGEKKICYLKYLEQSLTEYKERVIKKIRYFCNDDHCTNMSIEECKKRPCDLIKAIKNIEESA
jgi:hypothetical protein